MSELKTQRFDFFGHEDRFLLVEYFDPESDEDTEWQNVNHLTISGKEVKFGNNRESWFLLLGMTSGAKFRCSEVQYTAQGCSTEKLGEHVLSEGQTLTAEMLAGLSKFFEKLGFEAE